MKTALDRKNKRLNILFVADYIYPEEEGGSKRYIFEFARFLQSRGHSVTIIYPFPLEDRTFYHENIRFERIQINRNNSVAKIVSTLYRGFIVGRRFIRNNPHYDIVILNHLLLSYVMSRLIKPSNSFNFSVIQAIDRYEYVTEAKKFSGLPEPLKTLWIFLMSHIRAYIEKAYFKRIRNFCALSNYVKDLVLQHYPFMKFLGFLPGFLDEDKFCIVSSRPSLRKKYNLPEDRIIFLTIRRLSYRMGIDNLIKAVALLVKRYPDILLLIGGKGSYRKQLEKMAIELDLSQYVKFLGYIPETELNEYYNLADCFVLPSREAEGFGMVIIESMAAGTPVLSTPIGGANEIMSRFDKEFISRSIDYQDIADLMEKFILNLKDKYTREQYRSFVLEHYTGDIFYNKFLSILNCS